MATSQLIEEFESKYLVKDRPNYKIGDTVKVHVRIIEGEKERIQVFTGIVIAKKGSKLSETFTVYRNAYGCSMERVFLLNSPNVTKIEITRSGKVRRAKLYQLRGKSGKGAKVKEKIFIKKAEAEASVEEVKAEVKEEIVEEETKAKKALSKKKPEEENPEG